MTDSVQNGSNGAGLNPGNVYPRNGESPVQGTNFKSRFCERYACPPEEYVQKIFRRTLRVHARLLAPLIRLCSRDFFDEDIHFLERLGESTNWLEVKSATQQFYLRNKQLSGYWRRRAKIRVSGRKAGLLARELFDVA